MLSAATRLRGGHAMHLLQQCASPVYPPPAKCSPSDSCWPPVCKTSLCLRLHTPRAAFSERHCTRSRLCAGGYAYALRACISVWTVAERRSWECFLERYAPGKKRASGVSPIEDTCRASQRLICGNLQLRSRDDLSTMRNRSIDDGLR